MNAQAAETYKRIWNGDCHAIKLDLFLIILKRDIVIGWIHLANLLVLADIRKEWKMPEMVFPFSLMLLGSYNQKFFYLKMFVVYYIQTNGILT